MIVSWNWLKQYVALDMTPAELAERLMMAGLNHEDTHAIGDDLAINLEVTSNRPDCLGHLGIAREVSVLWKLPLAIPPAAPRESKTAVAELAKVSVENPAQCPRYTARVIRGVKIGASPRWLVDRLSTVGVAAINNVVDVTNYVLLECGQPLHAFDLPRLNGRQIVVRQARPGETFEAINHKSYSLDPSMCVIADAERAVALGGVMGGAATEVTLATKDVLLESAEFDPMSIRATARKLSLHSDSSYRFERGLDPAGVDWASRRAAELILELAGGELAAGSLDVGRRVEERKPITLRFAQLRRVLGIDVPPATAREILAALGNREVSADERRVEVIPPTWRRDLAREIDLVEEVARIHGYDKIPEDVSVPMATSHRTREDRVLAKVKQALTAAGFDEAMTLSAVEEIWSDAFSPWTTAPPLKSSMPILRGADRLRRSLIPSLLGARKTNESLGNYGVELFEIANIYLPATAGALPKQELVIGITSSRTEKEQKKHEPQIGYPKVKGIIEQLIAVLNPRAQLVVHPTSQELLDPLRSAELHVDVGREKVLLGFLGEVTLSGMNSFILLDSVTIAELRVAALVEIAELIPQYKQPPTFPGISRDINLVTDEKIPWADLEKTIRAAAAPYAEDIKYQSEWRDAEHLGVGKKSVLFSMTLRASDRTLMRDEADQTQARVVEACQAAHAAQLRA